MSWFKLREQKRRGKLKITLIEVVKKDKSITEVTEQKRIYVANPD